MAPKLRKGNKIPKARQGDQNVAALEKRVIDKLMTLDIVPRSFPSGKTKDFRYPNVGGQAYSKVTYGTGRGSMASGSQGTSMVFEKTEAFIPVVTSNVSGQYSADDAPFHAMASGLSWLSNMANAFTTYEFLKVEFTYVPAVPTTTAGAFSFAFLEDLRDDVPTTMTQLLATEQSLYAPVYAGGEGGTYLQQFGAPSGNVISFQLPKHVLAGADGTPKRFRVTKDATLISTIAASDAGAYAGEAYSPGRLVYGTSGVLATVATVGQIFVRYRVRLSGAISIANQQ